MIEENTDLIFSDSLELIYAHPNVFQVDYQDKLHSLVLIMMLRLQSKLINKDVLQNSTASFGTGMRQYSGGRLVIHWTRW